MAETWRVVLRDGSVREVMVVSGDTQPPWTAEAPALFGTEHGVTPWAAVVRLTLRWGTRHREILAPGELTRAELAARLATATASVQQLRADVELATAQRDAEACRADDAEGERDVLRAQQAPLVACVDALRAAATSAGWRDADATGETLVAWVRRGEREACAVRCDAIYTERDDAARKRRKYGTQNTCDGDCARLAGQAQGAAMCVEAIREGGE
mgnify:FL=1